MKNVILIRHGQSLGQTARDNGIRRKDESLVDCFLSNRGVHEAHELRSNGTLLRYNFDLVCTSPLSRAVATCVLALGHITEHEIGNSADGVPTTPFLAHSCISKAGKGIPENTGREIPVLRKI
jgi:broad specificity phosphatase PhoE